MKRKKKGRESDGAEVRNKKMRREKKQRREEGKCRVKW